MNDIVDWTGTPDHQVFLAARSGNVDEVKRLLEAALLREKAAEECAAGRKASLALQVLTLHALVYMLHLNIYTHMCRRCVGDCS